MPDDTTPQRTRYRWGEMRDRLIDACEHAQQQRAQQLEADN